MAGKRILIIDDDIELCAELSEILRDEGYLVESASDPIEGQDIIDRHLFDIAILDYKLPGMTGGELLRRIKNKNPDTKVFIVSGKPELARLIKDDGLSHIVSGIISKPFECEKLLSRIRE